MPSRDYNPLRRAIVLISGAIYFGSALAAAPLAWLLVARLREARYEAAAGWGLALLAVALAVMVWYLLAGALGVVIDNYDEICRLHRTTRAASDRNAQMLADLIERLDGLSHWTAMSEATRSLLSRRREAQVFVAQIEQAIGEGDWPEADRLIDLFQDHFGDAAQAERLRQQMAQAREVADDRVIRGRIGEVRTLIDQNNYPAAELAIDRLAKEYADDRRLDDLRTTLLRARRRYSESMQQKFCQLLQQRRFVQASTVLDEINWLDGELLAGLREQWKEAYRNGQGQLRSEFTTAVKAKQWIKAAELGELIVEQFAETPLCTEVRKVLETVRQRAKSESAAAAEPQP